MTDTRPEDPRQPEAQRLGGHADGGVRIIAIGASAGGLEPIEQFFDGLTIPTGLAFVIIQHLSPDFRSMMPELLKRHSSMPIRVIEDDMEVEPDTIYLNPPRSTLRISNGRFVLQEAEKIYEFTLPINDFFESLAGEHKEEAIGIVLSGTGSDGTLGAIAIAAAGGVVLVQDPSSSKFESMPRSVLNAVPGAVYALPSKLSETVLNIVAGKSAENPARSSGFTTSSPEDAIVRSLQSRFGIDFGYYKTSTVGRRINRRAQLKRMPDLADYAAELTRDTEELEALYADLLIGVTSFFRDRQAYEVLASTAIAKLGARMAAGEEIRVWSPGCATGEEPYSIAMLLAERARQLGTPVRAKIFATDIHPRSLRLASRGIFPRESLASVPEELRTRYFIDNGDTLQLSPAIREYVVFSRHNLIRDPPFTRMDLVTCRNLMIYLNDEAQRKCIALFHFALRKDGALFIGPSETLGALASEFDVTDARWRIFSKRRDVRLAEAARMLPLNPGPTRPAAPAVDVATRETGRAQVVGPSRGTQRHSMLRVYDAVLAKAVGTSILIDREGEVLHVFSDAGRFLRFGSGHFSKQIGDLIQNELAIAVAAGVEWCRKSEDEFRRSVYLRTDSAVDEEIVTVAMSTVDAGGPPEHAPFLITMTTTELDPEAEAPVDTPLHNSDVLKQRNEELERSLRLAEENLRSTTEELETANEELQATNEELQATNEELMAANEELQTVNEELHAVNEELYTVSAEHKSKIDQLTTTTADMDALLASTNIGVLFLDSELKIRRITPAVAQTFNILARDINRPIGHVTSRFEFPDLQDTVKDVMEHGEVAARNISVDGRDYLLRILPYYSAGTISGVVLTFVDISEIARANRSLTQFADIVSHDLRAPLRGIRAASNWIVEDLGAEAGDDVKAHAARLAEQTERLSRMLVELRDFSNLAGSKDNAEAVPLDDLISEVREIFDSAQLDLRIESKLPVLQAPRAALRLVFQNLLDNAVKHGGVATITVRISAQRIGDNWSFIVSDNGKGISPRHHDKIFLPFRKLQPITESPGSGIGLALVRKTIEELGGGIDIRSNPDREPGTTFVITLPDQAEAAS